MDKSIPFLLLFIVLCVVAYFYWQEHEAALVLHEAQPLKLVEPAKPLPAVPEKNAALYPVPAQPAPAGTQAAAEPAVNAVAETMSLPALDESDAGMEDDFARIYDPAKLARLFIFREFVRHVVVIVDNMTAKKLPRRFVFTQAPAGKFRSVKTADENEFILDEKNYARYQPFIDFANATGNRQLVSIYVRNYPLFQEAYQDLGYPGRYFNDRLIEVIDHLLTTPDVAGPIKLIRPKVFFQFADPALEKLSAGQKILLRMGNKNARLVKTRLKALRHILTTLKPG